MHKLDRRLNLVASLVPHGMRLCDVGTDHAFVPIYLVGNGLNPSAIASDLRSGPLESARKNIQQAGLSDSIALCLSDGLDQIDGEQVDCVVIAGMGGILITQILSRAPWLKDPCKHLVLQPMTDLPLVRAYLAREGFQILKEGAATAGRHTYAALSAAYTGVCVRPGALYCYTGLLPQGGEEETRRLAFEVKMLATRIEGLRASGKDSDQATRLTQLCKQIDQIIQEKRKEGNHDDHGRTCL